MLLQGRSLYDEGGANPNLAAYQPRLLSVPDSVEDCPPVSEVLPDDARHYLEAYQELMLKPESEMLNSDFVTPYFDHKLKYNQKEYHRFVKRLEEIGLIRCTTTPHCYLTVLARMATWYDARNTSKHKQHCYLTMWWQEWQPAPMR